MNSYKKRKGVRPKLKGEMINFFWREGEDLKFIIKIHSTQSLNGPDAHCVNVWFYAFRRIYIFLNFLVNDLKYNKILYNF